MSPTKAAAKPRRSTATSKRGIMPESLEYRWRCGTPRYIVSLEGDIFGIERTAHANQSTGDFTF